MSFKLLEVEPSFDWVTQSHNWTFLNLYTVKQVPTVEGNYKYFLFCVSSSPKELIQTAGLSPTTEELTLLSKKVGLFLFEETKAKQEQATLDYEYALRLCKSIKE